MLRNTLIALALTFGANAAQANDWSHIKLKSAEGIEANVDYIVTLHESQDYKPQHRYTAGPVYLNVSGLTLDATDQVRVVLNHYEGAGFTIAPYTYTVDLVWTGTHFSQELGNVTAINRAYYDYTPYMKGEPLTIRTFGYGGTFEYTQTLSIVVNGHWLTDPVNGTHDFQLNLFNQR